MDFHSLTRRELQALCKKNKIPANMTNVAMADALQTLQTVEGLEELLINPETESMKTPGKSMTGTPSVSRTSNRLKSVKVQPESAKLTSRTRRGTKKAEIETEQDKKDLPDNAAPSACAKEGNKSTAVQVYSTRRSTRLLEKKMGELSLKEDAAMIDVDASLEKDSQDLQRKFSEDLENSQVLEVVLEDKGFSDESNATTEVTEEPNVVEAPGQNKTVEPLNNNGEVEGNINLSDFSTIDGVGESIDEKECKNDEGQAVPEDIVEQLDKVTLTEASRDEFETRDKMNGIDGTLDAGSQPITETDGSAIGLNDTEEAIPELVAVNGVEILGSEADTYVDEDSAFPGVAPQTSECEDSELPPSTEPELHSNTEADEGKETGSVDKMCPGYVAIPSHVVSEDEAEKRTLFQMNAPEFSEDGMSFITESYNDGDCNNQEVDQLVESVYIKSENLCPVDILMLDNEVVPESLLAGDVHIDSTSLESVDQNNNDMVNIGSKFCESAEAYDEVAKEATDYKSSQSSPFQARSPLMPRGQFQVTPSKRSASVHRVVHPSDNKENTEVSARNPLILQDANVCAIIGTPIEKKSLRQLKKMVRGLYQQQAEEKRPALQARADNCLLADQSNKEN